MSNLAAKTALPTQPHSETRSAGGLQWWTSIICIDTVHDCSRSIYVYPCLSRSICLRLGYLSEAWNWVTHGLPFTISLGELATIRSCWSSPASACSTLTHLSFANPRDCQQVVARVLDEMVEIFWDHLRLKPNKTLEPFRKVIWFLVWFVQ